MDGDTVLQGTDLEIETVIFLIDVFVLATNVPVWPLDSVPLVVVPRIAMLVGDCV